MCYWCFWRTVKHPLVASATKWKFSLMMIEWWRKDQIIQMTSAQTQNQVQININGKCTGKKIYKGQVEWNWVANRRNW